MPKSAHISSQLSKLLTVGSFVLSIICILVGLIFFVAGPLHDSQELRRSAMIPTGTAELTFKPEPGTTFAATESASFTINLTPYTTQPQKTNLVFDIITHENIEVSDVLFHPESGVAKKVLDLKKVDHGYRVTFEGQHPDGGAHSTSSTPSTILTVQFHPKKTGRFEVNFNKELSRLVSVNSSGEKTDELRTVEVFEYSVSGVPTTPTSQLDDLYFQNLDSSRTKITFYELNTTTEVAGTALQPGKQYNIKHVSYLQNKQKSTGSNPNQIIVQLRINTGSTTIRNTLAYFNLASKTDGESTTLEGSFTAGSQNTFEVSIDPDNAFTEQSEANNSWSTDFTTTAGTKQCNETCSVNSDCDTNQRCYNTGSEKRCRLVTNLSSTSCSAPPSQGLSRSCNQYCADTRECAAGLTCWYNQCRLLQNLSSTSCKLTGTVSAATGTTKGGLNTTHATVSYQSCNESCRTNRDCLAGLRCYQKSCRHPLNVTSTACSATPETSASVPTPTTSPILSVPPRPSASPTASSSPSPRPTVPPTPSPILSTSPAPTATVSATAEPSPTPTAEPQSTSTQPGFIDSIVNFFTNLFGSQTSSFMQSGAIYGVPVPYVVIGLGALLFLIAIILMLFARKRGPEIGEPISTQSSSKASNGGPLAPLQPAHHNPPPPKEVLARRAAPDSSLIRAAVPAAVSKPTIQIATPPQTAQAPSNLKPAQPTAQITTPPVTQAPAVSTYNPASQTPQPPQRTNFGTPLHIATPVAQPTPVQTPRPATPPAMPAQSRPITPASSSSTPVTPVRPTPTPIVPAATVTPVTQPPAVVEKAPVPSLKNTEPDDLLVIPKTTTPVAPAAAPVQPVTQPPAPALSPDELLAQDHERPKMSMADRLKLKGIEFSNNSQNGEG